MVLEVKNVRIWYSYENRSKEVIKDVSFFIRKSEVLGLVGESGSGKTTLALFILNLLRENSQKEGKIILNNKDITQLGEEQWEKIRGRQITLIPQEPSSFFNPVLTLGYQFQEILKEKLAIKKKQEIEKIIFKTLEEVQIKDPETICKSYPHQLSGGQLQRVAIAMAVATKPFLLIADEPTSSLDVTTESRIINLLKKIKEDLSLSVLFITHNLSLARYFCDRIVVINKGEICEVSSAEEIFSHPKDNYTKTLIEAFLDTES